MFLSKKSKEDDISLPFKSKKKKDEIQIFDISFLDLPNEIKISILGFLSSQSEIPKYFSLCKEMNCFLKTQSTMRGLVLSKIYPEYRYKFNEYMSELELRELLFGNVTLEVTNLQIKLIDEGKEKELSISSGTALYEFEKMDNEELHVKEGEIVEVLEEQGEWLLCRNLKGEEGYVPTSYIEIEYNTVKYEMKLSLFPMNRIKSMYFDFTDKRIKDMEVSVTKEIMDQMKKQLEEDRLYEVCVQFSVRNIIKKDCKIKIKGRLL